MRLVADIGGTNARVALCAKGVIDPDSIQRFSNADWYSLNDILRAYCEAHPDAVINDMVIAVAGPVHAGRATLTNRNWTIIADKMAQLFSCNRVILLGRTFPATQTGKPWLSGSVLVSTSVRSLPKIIAPCAHQPRLGTSLCLPPSRPNWRRAPAIQISFLRLRRCFQAVA